MKTQVSITLRIENEDEMVSLLSPKGYSTPDEAIAFINKYRTDLPNEVINAEVEHGVDNIAETFANDGLVDVIYDEDPNGDFSGASDDDDLTGR
jgi:hypothetical protein